MERKTYICWTERGKKEVEHFRGTKTGAIAFYKQHKRTIDDLHYGQLILEKIGKNWVDI
jgi:hypothetical protein